MASQLGAQLCRLCSRYEHDCEDATEGEMHHRILQIFSFSILPDDESTAVCINCSNTVNDFHSFFIQVKESQLRFLERSYFITDDSIDIKEVIPVSGDLNDSMEKSDYVNIECEIEIKVEQNDNLNQIKIEKNADIPKHLQPINNMKIDDNEKSSEMHENSDFVSENPVENDFTMTEPQSEITAVTPAIEKNGIRNKRKRISIEEKYIILEKLSKGERPYVICKEFNLNESTIRSIKKNESKIRHWVSICSSDSLKQVSYIKDTRVTQMEKLLKIWIEDCNQKHIPLSVQVVKHEALKIYAYLKQGETDDSNTPLDNHFEFKASNGWFNRFITRFSLRSIKMSGERASADDEGAEKFTKKSRKKK